MKSGMDITHIYEVGQNGKTVVCPVLSTRAKSRELAFDWASSLARLTGEKATVYLNGVRLIDVPVQQ